MVFVGSAGRRPGIKGRECHCASPIRSFLDAHDRVEIIFAALQQETHDFALTFSGARLNDE
jgi:hypothetical protein